MAPRRPRIAFFDYPFVFEDFYPAYGVDQAAFATRWASTGNHAYLAALQRGVGDVTWYVFSLAPELGRARHEVVGCRVQFLPCGRLHRWLWRTYYLHPLSWRWRHAAWGYPAFAFTGSYAASAASRPTAPAIRSLGSGAAGAEAGVAAGLQLALVGVGPRRPGQPIPSRQ